MSSGARRRLGWLFRIGLSCGVLAWLFSRLDLRAIASVFHRLPVSIWVFAALLYLAAQVLSSVRWWILARTFAFAGRWRTYLGYYFVGMYFNLFLPTGLGGDVFKAHFLSRKNGRRMLAAFSVIGDRAFGLGAMLLLGAAAVRIHPGILPGHFVQFLTLAGAMILCGFIGLPFLLRGMKTLRPKIGERLVGLILLCNEPATYGAVLTLSFCLQALGMGVVALLAAGIGIEHISLAFYFAYLPLVTLITLIPVTFNGIGVREGAFVYFLGLKGVQAEPALSLGLLFFSVQVAASLLGGLIYAIGFHRRPLDPLQEADK